MKSKNLIVIIIIFAIGIIVGIAVVNSNYPMDKSLFCAKIGKEFYEKHKNPGDDPKTFLDIETELVNLCNVNPANTSFREFINSLQMKYK